MQSQRGDASVHHRLYDTRKKKEEKRQELMDKQEEKFNLEHTFQPRFFSARSDYDEDGSSGDNASVSPSARSARSGSSVHDNHQLLEDAF